MLLAAITGRVAEQAAVVEFRRPHHLAGIVQAVRIEAVLHLLERARQARTEHRLVEFRAHQSVAMLAGMRAFVFAHHGESLLGDLAHGMHVFFLPQIQDRPHMQAAGAGMGIPGAARAVFLEDCRQPAGIIGEMDERHRAVLNERNRFALLLHRHHDVEAAGAHVGDGGLQIGAEHFDHAAPFVAALVPGKSEIANQVLEPPQPAQVLFVIILAELDQQNGGRRLAHEFVQRRTENRDLARELDHGAVDQFDRDRQQGHDVLGGIHGLAEAAEMAGPDRATPEQRRQFQFDARGKSKRALRADQHMRQIDVVLTGHQRVEIIAANTALHLGETRGDLVGLARADNEQILGERT